MEMGGDNMRMDELEDAKDIVMFVKFVKGKHLEDLLLGKLYMNNIGYFIELEKKYKNKGMGDKREASFVIKPDKMYIMDSETNKIIGRPVRAEIIRRYEHSPKVPVFCFTMFTAKDFVFLKENEEYITFKLDIGEDSKKLLEFGDKAVIFAPGFHEKVIAASKKHNVIVKMKQIEYQSFDEIDREKELLFEQGSPEMFFWKHEEFSYQREVRLILPNNFVKKNYIFEIGSLEESTVLPIKDFFEKSAIRAYKKK